ncbi:MAG: carboxypeptidase regulatory-like domain-containing protein [Desulfobacterales bacterium]|nr:carboxypeptidase regulatory-like domain-containing protein [Desulfobacterales bacterium]
MKKQTKIISLALLFSIIIFNASILYAECKFSSISNEEYVSWYLGSVEDGYPETLILKELKFANAKFEGIEDGFILFGLTKNTKLTTFLKTCNFLKKVYSIENPPNFTQELLKKDIIKKFISSLSSQNKHNSYIENIREDLKNKPSVMSANEITKILSFNHTIKLNKTTNTAESGPKKGTGNISGTVTDNTGAPLSNIQVYAYYNEYSYIGSAYTNYDGTYTLYGLIDGYYKIFFTSYSSNYVSEWYNDKYYFDDAKYVKVTTDETTQDINVSLEAGGSISGIVQDINNQPVNDCGVYFYSYNSTSTDSDGYVYTDSNGNYKINGLKQGIYNVKFSISNCGCGVWTLGPNFEKWYNNKDDRCSSDAITVNSGQTTANINAQMPVMPEPGKITGIITDVIGNPIDNIDVEIYYRPTSNSGYGYIIQTDTNGTYTFDSITPGYYYININGNTWSSTYQEKYLTQWYENADNFCSATPIAVVEGETLNTNLTILESGCISGKVSSNTGSPIAGASVYIYYYDVNRTLKSGSTDSSGNYTICGLPKGKIKVLFSKSSYYSEWYNDKSSFDTANLVNVHYGLTTSNINTSLEPSTTPPPPQKGRISGTITDLNGIPVTDYSVYVYVYNNSGSYRGSSSVYNEGKYTVSNLDAGTYYVEFNVYSSKYINEWYNDKDSRTNADLITVKEGVITPNINASLAEGGQISGRIMTGSGAAIQSCSISASLQGGSYYRSNSISKDNCGYYVIKGLRTGTYQVYFSPSSQYCSSSSLSSINVVQGQTTSNVNIILNENAGGLSGQVVYNGIKYWYGSVYIKDLNNNYINSYYLNYDYYSDWNCSNNNFSFLSLNPGSYKVNFMLYSPVSNYNYWYNGKNSFDTADIITVTKNQTIGNIDFIINSTVRNYVAMPWIPLLLLSK